MHSFNDALKKNVVESISSQFNFKNAGIIEKFMMDFKILSYLNKDIHPKLRGGMCMPFHTIHNVRRLSIDVDLFTELPLDRVDQIMMNWNANLSNMSIRPYPPKDPAPIPDLVTYLVDYPSNFSNSSIKIDCICNAPSDIPAQIIDDVNEIMGFEIDYSLQILTRPTLIHDKITTLALDNVGLRHRGNLPPELPKQIYDIATLLKSTNLAEIKNLFEPSFSIIEYKSEIYDGGRYNVNEILSSIDSSLKKLFSFGDQIKFTHEYEGMSSSFKGSYLSTDHPYTKSFHMYDVLLVWFYSKLLLKTSSEPSLIHKAIDSIKDALDVHNSIKMLTKDERIALHKKSLDSMDNPPFPKNYLNTKPVDQVYLISKLFSFDS